MSVQELSTKIVEALGEPLSSKELTFCLKSIALITPTAGQQIWELAHSPYGLYIVLAGQVRLINPEGNLVLTLAQGTTVGECFLFSDTWFRPYTVRASRGVHLGYFQADSLERILVQFPQIRDRLYERALRRNLMLNFGQHPQLQAVPRSHLWSLVQNAPRETLNAQATAIAAAAEIWLIERGSLGSKTGQRLTQGHLYSEVEKGAWHAVEPTVLYRLSKAELERVQTEKSTPSGLIDSVTPGMGNLSGNGEVGALPAAPQSLAQTVPKAYFPRPALKLGHWWQQLTQQYPFVKQQSLSDCGVACLVMIGRYWGKNFGINQLRALANVNRNGASLWGLVTAAESVGFSTRPIKGTLEGLRGLSLPAIAHWEGNHYIVVYAITRRSVVVSDPAVGRRRLTRAQFQKGWTGYTLLLQPTQALQQAPEAQSDLWRFIELVKPYQFVFLEVLLASLVIQIFGLCTPIFTQVLLDRVVVERSTSTFFAAGTGLLIFSIFGLVMRSLRRYLLFHTANRIDLSLAVGFIAHALRLPQRYFDTRYVGDITSRIGENRTIRRFLSSDAVLTLIDMLMVFVYFGLMFWYSWQLALTAAVLLPILAMVTLVTTPFLKRMSREVFNTKTKEGSYLIEALTGVTTIKALGIERLIRWHWEELFNQSIKTNFSGQLLRERLDLVSDVIETTGTRLIFLFGVWQVINEQLSIGQLFAFNMLLGSVFSPFDRLISLWNDFQEVVIAVERLNDVLNTPPEEDEKSLLLPALPPLRGHVSFRQVTFRYSLESDRNTVENITFEVLPGQTVAIVGRSGSGKTTLAKLLLGLYPVTGGHILVDDYDINSITKTSLRRQMGVVDQETFLFGGTIRENISLAYPSATTEEIREAARLAGADQFINELPLKYETPIGEGGGMISGGQRQRLAIARALLGNPRLLVLDEATSSLDTESEHIIQTNLTTILKDRTTLIIAHRLSTIRNADLILVLDRGILVEQGTHEELMARRGQYFYLNQQQLTAVG
ncbi:MAG: peptidase domain-containing ABC transporter [Thermosynechococcaceae cyanobacterium MS004]|nr:peptidase domain-containing ABC transporter [Thermosynechococcaceae cyanobacterium MS004]